MLRQLIVRDLALKLLALALAVMFWIQVAGQPVVERGIDVPLGFENVPDRLYVGGDLPDSVRVRVRGAANIVSGLQPGDVVAAIDLAGERPGPRRLFDMFAGRVRRTCRTDVGDPDAPRPDRSPPRHPQAATRSRYWRRRARARARCRADHPPRTDDPARSRSRAARRSRVRRPAGPPPGSRTLRRAPAPTT